MKTVLYKENTRGHANHGWLETKHTFSFARYFNPNRMSFGLLRVVNDDKIAGGEGFGTHPHDNMEIVTIPLSGALAHKDSMGHEQVINPGEVQVMSAGTGITHSEYNAKFDQATELFQIWVFPRTQGLKPRYDQKEFDFDKIKNDLTLIVSPDGAEESLWVNQDVWFSLGNFDKNEEKTYQVKKQENGVFAMVVEGEFEIAGTKLSRRDAIGVYQTNSFDIKALSDNARILLIDVPMDSED
ncbi:MAG: pirin family protein [Bacteroides graminisolvens]|uniref:pirin family protein n=1 Tax=Bacteroides graminisolvens TaxID=477666 RepID=UPI003A880F0D